MIIGHESIINFFSEAIKNSYLHHAYTFVGPSQVGKRTIASHLGVQLLNTTLEKLNNHPDFFRMERVRDEKSDKLKKNITIEQVRQFKDRFGSKSWSGKYRVVIIDEAELLNEEAANALLKIIEEPPQGVVIFLLTIDDQALLPTIRSRTQIINFLLVNEQVIRDSLEQLSFPNNKVQECVRVSWGRPGRALAFLRDENLFRKYVHEVDRFKKLLHQPFYKKLEVIEDIFGKSEKDDHVQVREELRNILEIWEMQWREIMLTLSKEERRMYSSEKIVEIIDQIYHARILLRKNIHPRLIIENIVLEF